MIILVTGGSGSGKSAYAEQVAMRLYEGVTACTYSRTETFSRAEISGGRQMSAREPACDPRLIYLATMYNDRDDPETAARIQRHRRLRRDKGFLTIECPSHISAAPLHTSDTVILEDVPNLLANEMYREHNKSPSVIADELKALNCANLVIVTGIIDMDTADYDPFTVNYMETLSMINRRIAGYADKVTAVAAGIPVKLK